jgi:hypothetical protein
MTALALALLLSSSPSLNPPPNPAAPPAPAALGVPAVPGGSDGDDDDRDDGDAGHRSTTIQIGPNGVGVHVDVGHHHGHHHHGGRDNDRVVTGSVTIHAGEVTDDVVALAGSIELEPGAVVHDAVAVGGSVRAGAGSTIQGDAVAVGGSVELAAGAKVAGDAVGIGGTVEEGAGAEVGGDHVSLGLPGVGTIVALAAGAVGLGVMSPLWLVGSVLAKLIVFGAFALILLAFFPRRLEHLSDELFRIPGRSILIGALSVIAIPVLTLLLIVTLIGIPLVPVEILALAVMTAMGFSALALAVGRRLPFGKGQTAIQLVIGWLLLVLVFSIPILGTLISFACWVWVFGAVAATRFGHDAPQTVRPE